MPHFVVDCAAEVLDTQSEEEVIAQVHQVANASALFKEHDIKVRVNPYTTYSVGNQREPFIHVFSSIMQGRTTEQKAALSRAVVQKLTEMFPDVKFIAMNVDDFEAATYCNRNQL